MISSILAHLRFNILDKNMLFLKYNSDLLMQAYLKVNNLCPNRLFAKTGADAPEAFISGG